MFEVRKNCDDSGILFLLFAKYRVFEFLFFSRYNNSFYTHTGKNIPRKCFIFALHAPEIYIINFILHFERFFIYIYIFSSSFSSLVEIAYKNSERFYTFQNAFTTDIRYTFLHSSNLRRITFLIFRSNVYRKYK